VVGNKLQVSNIQSESGVDFQADARQMPLRDESVGAVFCSCFGHPSRRVGEEHLDNRVLYQKNMFEVYKEAVRILRPGGLIVVQGRLAEDLAMEKSFGFKLRQYSEFYDELTDPFRKRFDIVMEKVALPPAGERK
jgi:ubiquinone/menaquinone biosynthesis C-methylase UbiE